MDEDEDYELTVADVLALVKAVRNNVAVVADQGGVHPTSRSYRALMSRAVARLDDATAYLTEAAYWERLPRDKMDEELSEIPF